MKRFLKKHQNHDSEDGMTVIEVMVAIVIIAIVLVFTGVGLTASFRASVFAENRAKAAAYATDIISIAKQAPYRQLWIQPPTPGLDAEMYNIGVDQTERCTPTVVNPTGATTAATSGQGSTPFKGITHCQVRQAATKNGTIGTTFYIQTKIGYVPTGGGYLQKRVQVDVKWKDISSGNNKVNTYTETYTRTPSAGDCVPPNLLGSNPQAAGCA